MAKLYSHIRNKIRIEMNNEWNENKLGLKIPAWEVPRVKIDESKIIGNAKKIFWMLDIINRLTKECRVFTVLDNRDKESLLSLVIKNVITCYDLIEM